MGVPGIDPGDEVLVPAHTYMATAVAVLAVGAIPVIVDVDGSITMSPEAMEDAVGPPLGVADHEAAWRIQRVGAEGAIEAAPQRCPHRAYRRVGDVIAVLAVPGRRRAVGGGLIV